MKARSLRLVAAAVGCWLVAGGIAVAQPRIDNPYIRRPPISPYINLLRGGDQPLQYQGIIRPQLEFYRYREQQAGFNQQFQSQLQQLGRQGTGGTGHATSFFNYSHYYSAGQSTNRR
jgi:hypothetical protein